MVTPRWHRRWKALEGAGRLARSGTQKAQEHATAALGILALNADNSKAILAAGGIEAPILIVGEEGTEKAQENAAGAL